MTTFGKVLTFLNLLLGILFLVFAAPVAKHRIETQDALVKERDKVPPLAESVEQLDRDRFATMTEINRIKALTTTAKTIGANMKSNFERRIAVLTDRLNDSHDKVRRWTTSLKDVQTEIESRTGEINNLDQLMVADNAELKRINDEIADLEARWAKSKSDLEAARKDADAELEKLRRQELGERVAAAAKGRSQ